MSIDNHKQLSHENNTEQLSCIDASKDNGQVHFTDKLELDYSNKLEKIFMNDLKLQIKLLDQLFAGVFITHNFYFVYVNSYFANLLGYTSCELIGQPINDYIEEEDWQIIYPYEMYTSNIFGNSPIYRWKGTHKNGNTVYFEGKINDIGDVYGKYKFITVQDVTIKYEKERQLIESAKIYHRILMAIPEPVFITSNSHIIFANNDGLNLIKQHNDERGTMLEKKLHEYFIEEDQVQVLASFSSALLSEEAIPSKPVQVSINKILTEYELSCVKIDNYIGQCVILTVMRDLTERKVNEERIIRTEKLSVIGQLAAGVAHEIRNPLTALKGFTQLLRTKYSEHSYYFDIMGTEIDRINLIVNEFMTLAKPHLTSFQYNDVNKLIKSVLSILDTQASLLNIQVVYKAEEDAPKVYCNENQLKQVFLNLIKNAFESMNNGGVVTINLHYNLKQKMMFISITDQGEGMPESVRKRIGEPFLTTKDKGTGLGLMVTSRIVEDHNGKMTITSKEGIGTTIDVQIPFFNSVKHTRS